MIIQNKSPSRKSFNIKGSSITAVDVGTKETVGHKLILDKIGDSLLQGYTKRPIAILTWIIKRPSEGPSLVENVLL